jgi:hypothetical protein
VNRFRLVAQLNTIPGRVFRGLNVARLKGGRRKMVKSIGCRQLPASHGRNPGVEAAAEEVSDLEGQGAAHLALQAATLLVKGEALGTFRRPSWPFWRSLARLSKGDLSRGGSGRPLC